MRWGIDARQIQDHFPGIGRYTFSLLKHMAPLAPEDQFIALHAPRARNSRYDLTGLAPLPNVRLVAADAPAFSLRQQWVIPAIARRENLDIYHSPYYLMPYALPCPSIVTIHDLIPQILPQSLPRPSLAPVFRLLVSLAVARSAFVIADSEATQRDLLRLTKVSAARVRTIPLAADAAFRPIPGASETCRQCGLDKPFVFYLGTNKPHKNLVRLIHAWHKLPGQIRAGHYLVLAGHEDSRYPQVRQAVQSLALSQEVLFPGAVASRDIPTLYSGARAFVFPSLYEGFGLPVLEAMSCGTPVACANGSSLPQIVGDSAIMFDPLDSDDMCSALLRLLSDGELRAALARKGLARARCFSWKETARQTLEVYRTTAAARGD